MSKALFISRNDLVNKTPLGGNVDADKFLQFVEIAQETHIQNFLGTDLYNKISTDINASTLSGNYLTLVTDYIKPMLVHYAMSEYLPFAAFTIGNGGIFKHSSENSESATKEDISFITNKERQIAKGYTDRFLSFMSFNASTMFPEYYTNSNGDVNPSRDENLSSWVL
jgi:hypothetical protein